MISLKYLIQIQIMQSRLTLDGIFYILKTKLKHVNLFHCCTYAVSALSVVNQCLFTTQDLVDGTYNIRVRAVKLKRIVEMYQWEEQETEKLVSEVFHSDVIFFTSKWNCF